MRKLRWRTRSCIDLLGNLWRGVLCVEIMWGEVFATTFISCYSTFALSLVSYVLVSIAQAFGSHSSSLGHLYLTFLLAAFSLPPCSFSLIFPFLLRFENSASYNNHLLLLLS